MLNRLLLLGWDLTIALMGRRRVGIGEAGGELAMLNRAREAEPTQVTK